MNTVTINCASIKNAEQFHEALARGLDFPEWYGHNLDALYDCLTDIDEETELILNNWHDLEYALKDYSGKALYVFHQACLENDCLKITLHP